MIVAAFNQKQIIKALVEYESIAMGVNRHSLEYSVTSISTDNKIIDIQRYNGRLDLSKIPDNEHFKIVYMREPAKMPKEQDISQPIILGDSALWLDGYLTDRPLEEYKQETLLQPFIEGQFPKGVYSYFLLQSDSLTCGHDPKYSKLVYDSHGFCFTTFTRYGAKNIEGNTVYHITLNNKDFQKNNDLA